LLGVSKHAEDSHSMKPTLGWICAALLVIATPAGAQTMYRCHDLGKTIYSDKPCLNGDEVKQILPNGNPSPEYLARLRMKDRVEEQRARNAAVAAKREAHAARLAECEKSAVATVCKP
jgi:hypothetical protein